MRPEQYTDDVEGVIIGSNERFYYRFFCEGEKIPGAGRWFATDDEAHDYIRKRNPDEYKIGIEMRCFG